MKDLMHRMGALAAPLFAPIWPLATTIIEVACARLTRSRGGSGHAVLIGAWKQVH
jgi:hypothetical protein